MQEPGMTPSYVLIYKMLQRVLNNIRYLREDINCGCVNKDRAQAYLVEFERELREARRVAARALVREGGDKNESD